ncbi:hypothetical protein F3J34_38505 [Klebsiella sp. Ap-873]|nr:hypothetical protein [Klebsiella sp. Ap-873]
MAIYKYSSNIQQNNHSAFDAEHNPGIAAPYAGIYKCTNCGDEIAIAVGHTLPPQNHKQHTTPLPIKWKLVVHAVQN